MGFTPKTSEVKDFKNLPEININLSEIPSMGLPYPEGSTLTYRPYTFGEIKKISQSKLSDIQAYELILEGIKTSFNTEDLTIGDFLYLSLLRKLSTIGDSTFKIPYTCECGLVQEHVTKIQDFDFENLKAPKLPIRVNFEKQVLVFEPLTIKRVKMLEQQGKLDDESCVLASQVINKDFEEAVKIIDGFTIKEIKLLKKTDNYLAHSLKPIEAKCECGKTKLIELDRGQALILPFRGEDESDADKFHFGN